MTQQELTELNVGQNLDDLMNLDPRGYGVCRILYPAARRLSKAPLSMHAAQMLLSRLAPGGLVYILTGFVLLPHKKAEMDGVPGAMLLARSLSHGFGVTSVILCPEDCLVAMRAIAPVAGLHLYDTIEQAQGLPAALAVIPFAKDEHEAELQADSLLQTALPQAVISTEAPGANASGRYHNATGIDVTELEAKTDILFTKLQKKGVFSLSVGDLGNEIGMGSIANQLEQYIPRATGEDSIAAATHADCLITATVSDWGMYALIGALAFLKEDISIMHTAEIERDMMIAASRAGLVDMDGGLHVAIDGTDADMNCAIVTLMRGTVESALRLSQTCAHWFEKVLSLGFYEEMPR